MAPSEEEAAERALRSVHAANGHWHDDDPPPSDNAPRVVAGKSLMAFLESIVPHEPLIRGMLPRGSIYAFTGRTGHGKTTIATLVQVCVAFGMDFAGANVNAGRVLVLCGENPEDYCWHLRGQLEALAIDPADADKRFFIVDQVQDVGALIPTLHEAGIDDPFALVVVDTSIAFFMGEDENDNAAMKSHASALRRLTLLPGRPAVLVLCHPSKYATPDNMQPRGGGAFLGELDGNWELWKPEGEDVATLRCGDKHRGISRFESVSFELTSVTLQTVRGPDNSPFTSSVAFPLSELEAEEREEKMADDQRRLLQAIADRPDGTQRDWALACGWASGMGQPNTGRVSRGVKALAAQKLIEQRLRKYHLTHHGKRAIGGA